MSPNRELYSKLQKITGDVSLLNKNWQLLSKEQSPPLLISHKLAVDEKDKFIRAELYQKVSGDDERSQYKPLKVIDIDRDQKMAWVVSNSQSTFPPSNSEVIKNHNAFVLRELNQALEKFVIEVEQSAAVVTKQVRKKWRIKAFNTSPEHEEKVKKVKQKVHKKREDSLKKKKRTDGSKHDLLQTKALYKRLVKTFGDLENAPQQRLLRGETTGNSDCKDILLEYQSKSKTHGLFTLYTSERGNSATRTMVAAFLVDFVKMQAQATPALYLMKGAYTLAMRWPEHVRELKQESQLGALLPMGIKNTIEREKAYRTTLSLAGVNPEEFYAVPQRFLSSGQRLARFCNMATDGMLRQLQQAGYEGIEPARTSELNGSRVEQQKKIQGNRAKMVKITFDDGREHTITVNGLREGESFDEVIRGYVAYKAKIIRQKSQERREGISRKSRKRKRLPKYSHND